MSAPQWFGVRQEYIDAHTGPTSLPALNVLSSAAPAAVRTRKWVRVLDGLWPIALAVLVALGCGWLK